MLNRTGPPSRVLRGVLSLVMRPLAWIALLALIIPAAHVYRSPVLAFADPLSAGSNISAQVPAEKVPTRARYLVLIVLDGARPDYFGLTRLPHVDALRARGTQYTQAIDGILESETPAGHTTIATGSTPARNGILGFDWAQNDNDYSLFSPTVVRAGAIERIMAQSGVPTLAGLYKAKFHHAIVVALSGHKYYAADPLGGPKADVIMYYQGDPQGRYVPVSIPGHSPPAAVLNAPGLISSTTHLADGRDDHFATLLALSAFRVLRPRMLLINYPEFDWPLGHVYGGSTNRSKVITLMKTFDHDLGSIERAYRRAGILKRTLFVITADHGMAPISHFIPTSLVSNAVAAAGTTAPSVADSTGAYIWLRDPSKATAVADAIARKGPSSGIQSAYWLSTSGGKAHYVRSTASPLSPGLDSANRYLLATLLDGHQPNVVAFAANGYTFASSSTHWKADHGGPSWQSQHIPLIFSGPGIQRGVITNQPAQLEDVAPTVLWDMGVTPSGMEGTVLTDALLRAPDQTRQAWRAQEIRTLTRLVTTLRAAG